MRYLAIDYGPKRTGLAICDCSETITSPLAIIRDSKHLLKKITDIIKAEDIDGLVLGLPLNMDDSEGPQAKLVYDFARELKKNVNIPIHFQDERLSTFAAEEKLGPADFTRNKKKKRLDAVAAAEILQAFLDKKSQE